MRKLLLCLVIGLSAAMLFAVDITTALETGGGSWTSAPAGDGGGSDLKVTFDASDVSYVKVGFADAKVTETSGDVTPATTAALTNQDDATGKISMDSSKSVYVYYDVKTTDTITIALEAQSMASTLSDNAPTEKITFYVHPEGGSKITSGNSLPGSSSNNVLTYNPGESDPAVNSVKLDIYTTLDDIPVGARGSYSGLVRMYVTAAGE